MPKKTNKTAHVLNLLSTGLPQDQDLEQELDSDSDLESVLEQELDSEQEPSPIPQAPPTLTSPSSKVRIVDSPTNSTNPLANTIKESLDLELQKIITASALTDEEAAAAEEPEEEASSPAQTTHSAPVAQPVPPQKAQAKAAAEHVSPAEAEPVLESSPSDEENAAEREPDYRMVNVMKEVVADRLLEFMEKFNVCTCDRCRVDTMALALSNMPPKYIVAQVPTISPLLNFYKSKYASAAMTELTKACLQVQDNPRH